MSWSPETRVPELPVGENGVILRSLLLTQHKRVTDRQTDGRTHCLSLKQALDWYDKRFMP